MQKPRVIEIQVRMDCNGCVQKIKKALHGINGIYELDIDFPQQKLKVVGWADPDKIIKAIRKARKIATICTPIEPTDSAAQPAEPAPEGGPPAPNIAANPPAECPPAEVAPPVEPPKDPPPPEVTPLPVASATTAGQPVHSSGPNAAEKVHVIYDHHPPDYSYGGYRNNYPQGQGHGQGLQHELHNYTHDQGLRHEPPPPNVYVTHSYNTYKPSPYVSEYEYIRSPPRHTLYRRTEYYSEDNHNRSNGGDGNNITSMFSDENPNACRIV
ncbi:hypothetical protein HHK36_012350 [Tetracentron sinense]|uniref:HMA domain-containing protein n=1 Tax=Tetracentron sinense TaxID=13715 RepID=A0A834Z940_TETSI|nr:hypothetical protein HHK36_012350 [Tetracentron sinense]